MNDTLYKIRLFIALIFFILSILGILGIFYPINVFDIQFTPLIQKIIVNFSIISLSLLIIVSFLTLLFGRFYCSLLCPIGIFQEIICLITKRDNEAQKTYQIKYFIAVVTFGLLIGGSTILIKYIDPYSIFGSAFTLSITGIVSILIVGLIAFFKNRFFCTDICPVGTIIGLLSKFSLFKIHIDKDECLSCTMCERSCQAGCINVENYKVNNETCIKCLKCLTVCPKGAINYGLKPKEKISFNQNRRSFLITSAAVITLLGAVKIGINIANKTIERAKEIILPAGGVNLERMLNKCLNCNLCVEACPQKIITKADKNFGAIHIDYDKGKKYCDFDCNECEKVCPSGAIKKISIEEKQKTRIATAKIDKKICINCNTCLALCPVNAIYKDENENNTVDISKCIGCGKCKFNCNSSAIEIFAVKEQKVL